MNICSISQVFASEPINFDIEPVGIRQNFKDSRSDTNPFDIFNVQLRELKQNDKKIVFRISIPKTEQRSVFASIKVGKNFRKIAKAKKARVNSPVSQRNVSFKVVVKKAILSTQSTIEIPLTFTDIENGFTAGAVLTVSRRF